MECEPAMCLEKKYYKVTSLACILQAFQNDIYSVLFRKKIKLLSPKDY